MNINENKNLITVATQVKLRGTNRGVHTHFHAG